MKEKAKVILRRADTYDPTLVARIIRDGLDEFGLAPRIQGKITIKPNVVMAHHKVTPSAYTRPEFLDGLLTALEEKAQGEPEISVAEKCGAAIPTSRMFRRAGYYRLRKKHRFKLRPIEEARKKTVPLQKGKVHQKVRTSREIAERDFLIYAPKLKTNALAHGLTAALKLNIGILCDGERMWNHNYNLDEKVVDLLEIGHPDFIATDAIEVSFGGNHLTQHGHPLGVIIMATDPLAHDVVCAHIFHLDPEKIGHLAAARARGYGSLDLGDIEIRGDISLQEIRERTKTWETGFIRADDLDCNIKIRSGEPYCTGGCHGIFLDWLYMIKDRKPKLWAKLPAWTTVIGKYKGDITTDRLLLIGACTEIEGRVKAKRKIRIRGCPPKHKTLVLLLFLRAGIINPLFRFDLIIDSYPFLFWTWFKRFITGRF
ncbi:MAG: hypothetical protein A2Y69_02765 [Candidatus Aminicenantes bacterium RBG_13_59_9]|nr:MAG: hypothetical protein A2Y69_02765 [Candidatus Aminicenantes bacterium RBG_13_59_9]